MTDAYLRGVLVAHAPPFGLYSPVLQVQAAMMPIIRSWGGAFLIDVTPSGSFAKGTAVRGGTDIDLFISVAHTARETLSEVYETLFNRLAETQYAPRRQNVSIGTRVNGYSVDLVPAKRQQGSANIHSLHSTRTGTWMQTDVSSHIATVRASNRVDEIRLLKIWRNRRNLDFPSFYLELAVIRALYGRRFGDLSNNVRTALEFIRDEIQTARIMDPANTNNEVSGTLNFAEKRALAAAAASALGRSWGEEFV